MANTFQNATTNAVWIPEIIANKVLGRLGAFLNLGSTVSKDFEWQAQQVGDTVNITKRGAISANAKSQGSATTMNQPTATQIQVSLNQHWEVTVGQESFSKALMQNGDQLPGYLEDSVIALAEKIELTLVGLYSGFSTTVGETASESIKTMNNVRQKMVENYVPRIERKYAYLHPSFVTRLLNASAFIDPKIIPNGDALATGALGRTISGFDVFEGQLVDGTGSPDVYQNLCYTRDAMVLATRPLELPSGSHGVESAVVADENGIAIRCLRGYDIRELGTVQTLDVLFGAAVSDARRGVVLHTS